MPKGPRGEKRPRDVVGNAVHVMKILTGEIEEQAASKPQTTGDMTASEMGKKGGKARAQKLSPTQRVEIARKAARKRWGSR